MPAQWAGLSMEQSLLLSGALIWVAALFDFLDGFAARLLHVSSPIGKELDSLADVVSFGVLPGFILLRIVVDHATVSQWPLWTAIGALAIPVFSALRLAKFNVDTRQSDRFIGVPTPANALFFSAMPFIFDRAPDWAFTWLNPPLLLGAGLVMSLLLVSELPLFALKFKSFGWAGNEVRFGFLAFSVLALLLLQAAALPLVIIAYILSSWLLHLLGREV